MNGALPVEVAAMWIYREGWQEVMGEGERLPGAIRVVTQNLWFDAHQREARLQGHLRQWQELSPDIIAIQEATLACLRPLLDSQWLRDHYCSTASSESPASWQGVVLFCRQRPQRAWMTTLPGTMGRRLLNVDFGELQVGVVHLESTRAAAPIRREQLEVVFATLAPAPSALLVGDFNLCSTSAENDHLSPDYLDLWPTLRPGEAGFTQDSGHNLMLWKQVRKRMEARYDRMLLRSTRWRAGSIERVGTQPLAPDLFASDHFGLRADLLS